MASVTDAGRAAGAVRAIPSGIWALGFVSMFMDISSEMVHSLLPLFLVSSLGASTLAVGVIEGVAEATASITKIFSGTLSDYLGRRKALATVGYGLAALTKPMFPLASSVAWVVTARFVDRVGKGIRGAPRDALVADLAPRHLRGACFGLRQSLDTVGACVGPLFALLLMLVTGDSYRTVFWIAVLPAFIAVAILIFGVSEPDTANTANPPAVAEGAMHADEESGLGTDFWCVLVVATLLTLARFSEAFLVLRARDVGLTLALVPLVMVVMNVAYAISSYPIGALSDRMDRRHLLAGACFVLVLSDLVLAHARGVADLMFGVALWGVHMGATQGLLAAMVADAVPARRRGTAFGIFNLAGGVAVLIASIIAGALWQRYGPLATFNAGAVFTLVAAVATMTVIPRRAATGA
jgi:MFS family permease